MSHHSYVNFCTKPWEELVVYPDGSYSICCGGPPVGRIKNAYEIKDIWNNPIILQYRENLNNSFEFGICTNCVFHGTLRNTFEIDRKRERRDLYQPTIPVISFGLTDQCNLSCFMCGVAKKYTNINRKVHAARLSLEFCSEFAIHHFSKANIVNSNCFGEVFLYPKLKKFLRLLKENRPLAYTTTTTSGSLRVPEKLWREVIESHDQLLFSVDSHNKMIHKVIRGFDYDILERNIGIVRDATRADYPKFRYGCSVVLMKMTITTLFDTLRISHEKYGCNLFHFQHISDMPDQSLSKEKEWRSLANKVLIKCQDYMKQYNIGTNGGMGLYKDPAGNIEE